MINDLNTILIVDDMQVGRQVLKRLLASEEYQIAMASNGEMALQLAAELIPDLILLDVRMPGMDGFEVCRRLRTHPQLSEVPIMFVTALGDRDSRLLALEAGADDFITKPIDRVELQARVRAILRLNRYRRLLLEREQRQQAEHEIMQREHELTMLKQAEIIKDRFVSTVSHELRTPLSVMTLLIGNLDTYYEHLDDERRRGIIRDIRSQTRTLNELVENVLEIASIDGRKNNPEYRTVDLAYIAREETEKQMPLAHKKGHQIQVVGVNYLPVLGHEGQLRQIIRNLLNNAIKYTPDGGRIICECRAYSAPDNPVTDTLQEQAWPERSTLAPGNWASLRVCDSGIGIAPEEITHVFERFYRVTSQDNISGTGLGLSIAQELVEAHGGKITLASNLHEGSIFVVYLPLVEEV